MSLRLSMSMGDRAQHNTVWTESLPDMVRIVELATVRAAFRLFSRIFVPSVNVRLDSSERKPLIRCARGLSSIP